MTRPPVPPFTEETARQKVRSAEDAWNTRDPSRVAAAYTPDSVWRNRSEFLTGRAQIDAFLVRKWQKELDYALRKELWAFTDTRIAVRFQYEYMSRRESSINDVAITEAQRRIFGERSVADEHDSLPLE